MISIIIPTYNEEHYIRSTLEHLRKNVRVPIEIIVTDDRSTDRTVEIARELADIVVVPDKKHPTIAANRNYGARSAKGDVLLFTDSSCIIRDPDAVLARAIDRFAADPKLVALTGKLGVLPELETFGDRIVYLGFNMVHFLKNNVLMMGEAPGKFQIIRRSAFDAVGGFREDLVTREDGNLFHRLAKIGKTRWDPSMAVLHSGRRAHEVGWAKLLWVWTIEAFWVAAFGKSKTKEWVAIHSTMRVSIVVPAHNEERGIASTIEALLKLDYKDYEVIVVNNASSDRTAEIAARYPVRLVNEPIKGLLSAREAGRRAATGELIANVDADCLPDKDWLRRGVRHFADAGVVAATGPYDYHDAAPALRHSSLIGQKTLYKLMNAILQMRFIRKGAVLIGGNNIIRSSVLAKSGGYDTSIAFYGEDTNTAKRISRHGRIVFDPKFHISTSARRFRSEGTMRIMLRYWYHFFRQIARRDMRQLASHELNSS